MLHFFPKCFVFISSGGGSISASDIAGIIGGLAGPGSKSDKISGLISGIGELINKKGQYGGGGE